MRQLNFSQVVSTRETYLALRDAEVPILESMGLSEIAGAMMDALPRDEFGICTSPLHVTVFE